MIFLTDLLTGRDGMDDDDIIVVADSNVFLSLPRYINVLQSGHQAWMFLSEVIFYLNQPWNQVMALTLNNWRQENVFLIFFHFSKLTFSSFVLQESDDGKLQLRGTH